MKIIASDACNTELDRLTDLLSKALPTAEIYAFSGAENAISRMADSPCEVAFITLGAKGDDGLELAKELKKINSNVNIIFVSEFTEYMKEAFEMHASGYITAPLTVEKIKKELEDLRHPPALQKRLKASTFGNFEVSVNGEPLIFKYHKSKELFAYLVDRRGATCSTGELTSILFEDSGEHKAYYHRLRQDLIGTLRAYGCEDVILQQRGVLGVCTDKIECDYYDYLSGKSELSALYHGEYMAQYSFAEITNAELFARLKGDKK